MSDIEATLNERGSRYGDFSDHAAIAQRLQDDMRGITYIHGADAAAVLAARGWSKLSPVQRQALTVIADKIARILSGDPNYTDNWHDIQGYAKLAEDRCVKRVGPIQRPDACPRCGWIGGRHHSSCSRHIGGSAGS